MTHNKLLYFFFVLSLHFPIYTMRPVIFYYEFAKSYYREMANDMQGVVSDHIPANEASSSDAIASDLNADQYVWALNTKYGNKPERVARFIDALKNTETNVYQAAKDNRLGKSTAYKLRDMMLANPEVLPGYKLRSEVPSTDLSAEQKSFLANYIATSGPRVILKDLADALSDSCKGSVYCIAE